MFDSGIALSDIIQDLNLEVDIAVDIPDTSYIAWLNSLEQLLYSEFIQEQREIIIKNMSDSFIDMSTLNTLSDEEKIRFEDIYTMYADDVQLIKTTLTSGDIFKNTYFKYTTGFKINCEKTPDKIRLIYFVKPKTKTKDNYSDITVKMPSEFIEVIKSKLRGEAYKIANEDVLAAKWLNDYNILLENFKTWLANRQAQFGM